MNEESKVGFWEDLGQFMRVDIFGSCFGMIYVACCLYLLLLSCARPF